ncbi:F0F1 ATP synthase subunit B [Roseomonas xinghualingensis]|uniref:F0F1 ATP synthase subunit B family protein n=1 Tax=Roseomonas xinghualingensis TaxID=2986475 RepID=UPI0021F15942|nr:F0F1 ATP synthase subunit B [Roseomonas sp. SXEYE001]MCV4206206.1 F0F1 ATP synthase subunit B [Roseomonas sp. SXEYE001]
MHHYEHFWLDPKFWVAVSFILFVVLLGRMIWSKLAAMLDARGDEVRAQLAEATRLREEAEVLRKQAEAERAEAVQEAEAMIARARGEAERVATAAAAEAEANAARRERMAMDRIAAAESSALAEVRQAAAEIAANAARSVIAEKLTPEGDAAMIDKAVADLPRALRAA